MSTEKNTILNYLPPEQRQKLIVLLTRLKQQTEARNKYEGLYHASQQSLSEMTLKYNQLKDENKLLKQQITNSFSIVSQVRANFQANKDRLSKEKEKQLKDDDQWEDDDEENQENSRNNANQVSISSKQEMGNQKSHNLQQYRPPMTASKKSSQLLNLSSNELNNTQLNSSRSKDILELKREITEMQSKKKEFKQKMKKVEEIKNMYKMNENTNRKSTDTNQQSIIERIDITNTFEDPHKSKQKSHRNNHQSGEKSQKPKVIKEIYTQQKKAKQVHQVEPKFKSPGKGHVITSQDIDVLDQFNFN